MVLNDNWGHESGCARTGLEMIQAVVKTEYFAVLADGFAALGAVTTEMQAGLTNRQWSSF